MKTSFQSFGFVAFVTVGDGDNFASQEFDLRSTSRKFPCGKLFNGMRNSRGKEAFAKAKAMIITMKKKAIFTIAACSIAALFLIFVLAVGLSEDGFGLSRLAREAATGWEDPVGEPCEYTWDPEETAVSGLNIDWINGKVEVKVCSGNLIRITETPASGALAEEDQLKLSSSGGILKIQWDSSFRLISLGLFENRRKDLTVEVPRSLAAAMTDISCSNTSGEILISGFTAESLRASSTSGNIDLSDLRLSETLETDTTSGLIYCLGVTAEEGLHASTTSGTITLTDARTGKAELNTVSGKITYSGTAEEFHGSSVSALIRGEFVSCPEKVDLSSVSGLLTVALPENSGFEAEYSSISGNFSSDFPVSGGMGTSGRALYASGTSSFQFSTTSGNMQVLKK